MSSMFSKPKINIPPPPPPPPQIDDAARSEEMTRKLARRRGRYGTVKTANSGLSGGGAPSVAVKTLLAA